MSTGTMLKYIWSQSFDNKIVSCTVEDTGLLAHDDSLENRKSWSIPSPDTKTGSCSVMPRTG